MHTGDFIDDGGLHEMRPILDIAPLQESDDDADVLHEIARRYERMQLYVEDPKILGGLSFLKRIQNQPTATDPELWKMPVKVSAPTFNVFYD